MSHLNICVYTHTHTHTRTPPYMLLYWLSGKNTGDVGSLPGSRRSLGEGNGNPLQYFCLGNPMNKEAWQATVHGVAEESDTV